MLVWQVHGHCPQLAGNSYQDGPAVCMHPMLPTIQGLLHYIYSSRGKIGQLVCQPLGCHDEATHVLAVQQVLIEVGRTLRSCCLLTGVHSLIQCDVLMVRVFVAEMSSQVVPEGRPVMLHGFHSCCYAPRVPAVVLSSCNLHRAVHP